MFGPMASSASLNPSDWLQFAGVILAAVVGVSVALGGHAWVRSAERSDGLDRAIVDLFASLSAYAQAAEAWAAPAEVTVSGSMGDRYSRGSLENEVGGPSAVPMLLAVESAILSARSARERNSMLALKAVLSTTQSRTIKNQLPFLEEVVENVRLWRTRELSDAAFLTWAESTAGNSGNTPGTS